MTDVKTRDLGLAGTDEPDVSDHAVAMGDAISP